MASTATGSVRVSWINRLIRFLTRGSLLKWMVLLLGTTLLGLGALGILNYSQEARLGTLLEKNSTYIQLDKSITTLRGTYEMAMFAVDNAGSIAPDQLQATFDDLEKTHKAAATQNNVPALSRYFGVIESAIKALQTAAKRNPADAEAMRAQLEKAATAVNSLSYIASSGAQSEWRNLFADNKSSFELTLMVILGVALTVGILGVHIVRRVRGVFSDVVRINEALSKNNTNVDIPDPAGAADFGHIYAAFHIVRDSTIERAELLTEQEREHELREQRQKQIESMIGEFRAQIQDLLFALDNSTDELNGAAESLSVVATENSGRMEAMTGSAEIAAQGLRTVASATDGLSALPPSLKGHR